jgi:tetratricopeptide (TPR) repeat protein
MKEDRGLWSAGKRIRLTALLTLFAASVAYAQWIQDASIDQRLQRGISRLYNFEFDKAETDFTEVTRLRPDHPAGYFFKAMILWEKILCNIDDESMDKSFYAELDNVIEMSEKRLDANPRDVTALFFKGGAIGFRGRLRANRGKWVPATNDGLIALPLVRKAYELDPKNYDVLLGMGIYNYYAEVIPSRYPVAKPLMIFFPSGNKAKGMEQLKLAAEHAKYAGVEASYFLMQNYYVFEKDYPKALDLAKKLHQRFPNNSIFERYLGRCLVSVGAMNEANAIYLDIEHRFFSKQIGYDIFDLREAYHYIGKYRFSIRDYDAALLYFFKCDELSRTLDKEKASGFMSMSNLYVGMIYDMEGKRSMATMQYHKVLEMEEYEDSHTEAQLYLRQPYTGN